MNEGITNNTAEQFDAEIHDRVNEYMRRGMSCAEIVGILMLVVHKIIKANSGE